MKKNIFIVLLLFLIVVSVIFTIFDKSSTTTTKDRKQIVKNTLSFIEDSKLQKELENNIDTVELYNELKQIHNYQYTKELSQLLINTNNKLKENNSSIIKLYKNEKMPISEILRIVCEDEYQTFVESYFIGDDNHKNFPKEEVESLYNELLITINTEDYENVIKTVDKLLKKYKFTATYNLKIANVYHDAIVLKNENNLSQNEMMKTLYDPVVYTLTVLSLSKKEQENYIDTSNFEYITNKNQLSIENIETKTISIESKDYKNMYKTVYDFYSPVTDDPLYTFNITEITFNNNYKAYVLIDIDKVCNLYTIMK